MHAVNRVLLNGAIGAEISVTSVGLRVIRISGEGARILPVSPYAGIDTVVPDRGRVLLAYVWINHSGAARRRAFLIIFAFTGHGVANTGYSGAVPTGYSTVAAIRSRLLRYPGGIVSTRKSILAADAAAGHQIREHIAYVFLIGDVIESVATDGLRFNILQQTISFPASIVNGGYTSVA